MALDTLADVRFECLKLALGNGVISSQAVTLAAEYENYVWHGRVADNKVVALKPKRKVARKKA